MLVSEFIAKLQALQAKHGDLEVRAVVPEGPYARVEGEPDIISLGYCDEEGEYQSDLDHAAAIEDILEAAEEEGDTVTDEDIAARFQGPYICIGSDTYE